MKKTMLTLAFGLMIAGPAAFALTADEVVVDLQAQGFTPTQTRTNATWIKVEAIRGTQKREMILDKTTGAVLKDEVTVVQAGEVIVPGTSARLRVRDAASDADRDRTRDRDTDMDDDGEDDDGPDHDDASDYDDRGHGDRDRDRDPASHDDDDGDDD